MRQGSAINFIKELFPSEHFAAIVPSDAIVLKPLWPNSVV